MNEDGVIVSLSGPVAETKSFTTRGFWSSAKDVVRAVLIGDANLTGRKTERLPMTKDAPGVMSIVVIKCRPCFFGFAVWAVVAL